MENQFIKTLKKSVKHWYIQLIIGFIFISAGVWTFTSSIESYLALSFLFSISFLVSGILDIVFAISNKKELENWGWILILGIMSLLVGIMLLNNPEISLVTLPLYVGFVVMFRSFGAIGLAMDLKDYGNLEWRSLMIPGILGAIFSFILLWNPVFSGMTLVIWTGVALISIGIFYLYLAIIMVKLNKNWNKVSNEIKSKYHKNNIAFYNELIKINDYTK